MNASIAFLLFGLSTSTEEPSTQEQARALFEEGVGLSKEGDWAGALGKFEASRALVERPSTLFNQGLMLVRLGRPTEAIKAFEDFLGAEQNDDEAIAVRIGDAERMIAEAYASLATLRLLVQPSHARVQVGDRVLPQEGEHREIALDPGDYEVAVSAEHFISATERVSLNQSERVHRRIELAPEPAPIPSPSITPFKEGPIATADAEEPRTEFWESPFFWAAAGIVAVGTAVAIVVATRPRSDDDYRGSTGRVLEALSP